MATRDPERERQRLAQRYAAMSEVELSEIAADARSLTDEAKEALRAEIARRGLDIALGEPEPEPAPGGPVVLRRYLWLHEAPLAKTILDSAGIECTLADEHTIRMDWFWSLGLGEVKVWMRAEDGYATVLLDQGWVESFMVSGVGEYVQPRCSNCGSFEISQRALLKGPAYLSLALFWLLSIMPPLALHDSGWRCHACGHLWEEEPEAPAPVA